MSQITLRNIPTEVERRVRALSKTRRESINATINQLLARALDVPYEGSKRRDLSAFTGTWTARQYEEFQAATRQFSQVDDEVWGGPK